MGYGPTTEGTDPNSLDVVQPAVALVASFELRRGPSGHGCLCRGTDARVRHEDDCTIIGEEGHAHVEFDAAIRARVDPVPGRRVSDFAPELLPSNTALNTGTTTRVPMGPALIVMPRPTVRVKMNKCSTGSDVSGMCHLPGFSAFMPPNAHAQRPVGEHREPPVRCSVKFDACPVSLRRTTLEPTP
jgi:hypothetical protein